MSPSEKSAEAAAHWVRLLVPLEVFRIRSEPGIDMKAQWQPVES